MALESPSGERPVSPGLAWPVFALVLFFFFVSGACGLLYQVVWTRKLVLLFGTTAYAVSTVLSIFFLGLGFGSLWGGRLADRTTRPLRLYGLFEIIVGLWALLFILTVSYGEGAVVAVLKIFDWSRGAAIGLRALLALVLLLAPVALMGATLPLLSKFVTRQPRVRGLPIGALYTVNTLGAVAGCFFTGFFLLATQGYTRTTLMGAVANVVVGLVALGVSQFQERTTGKTGATEATETAEAPERRFVVWLVLGAFTLSGFCALALEVLWTRLLVIVFLGTTYAYTTMLTTLLCGIALGSAAASLLVDRLKRPAVALGIVMALSGVLSIFMLSLIADLPQRLNEIYRSGGSEWAVETRGKFVLSFMALFPPTFCFGMTFPLVVRAASSFRVTLGRDIGILYSANTFGGVLGAMAGGFVLIPLLGAHQGIVLLGVLLFIGACALLAAPPVGFARMGVGALLTMLMALALMRAPEDVSQALNAGYVPEDHRVLSFREGVEGTVAVSEPVNETGGSNRVLWINRVQATASIEKGVKMNRLQGALPLLFDRDPKRVLFMCFGSGITCGTLALAGFEHIDAVEISPDVQKAAPLFAVDNLNVIERPNVQFHIDDGRNYLLTTDNRYDVITFEPMPLALAGVSTFYTQQYYQLCLEHLAPGGLVSQWVPLHGLNPEVVRSLVYTFTTVFPHYTAWFINADVFLIGSNQPLQVDYVRATARLAQTELQRALALAGFDDAIEVLASFLLDAKAIDAFAAGGTLMTDDRPWAEFLAPKLVYGRTVQDSVAQIEAQATPIAAVLAPGAPADGLAALELRQQARLNDLKGVQRYYGGLAIGMHALEPFFASLEIDPNDFNAQFYVRQIVDSQVEVLTRWEEYGDLEALLQAALQHMPHEKDFLLYLGDTYFAQGKLPAAAEQYTAYLALGGDEPRAEERRGGPGQ
ncbi:MAG: fused MFS/spermidine synthase [Candidatus Hydrogenedentes bacterium]|nr:fused MFS/spermidine synthase [Candidatus Hydrogenedentota bacterium]